MKKQSIAIPFGMCVIAIVALLSRNSVAYYDGRHLTDFSPYVLFLALLAEIVAFVITLVNLTTGSNQARIDHIFVIALLLVINVFGFNTYRNNPGFVPFMDGFISRAKPDLDAEQLQKWGVEILSKNQEPFKIIPNESVPKNIRLFGRHYVCVSGRASSGARVVDIEYGGGFAHFGIMIGNRNLKLSSDDSIYVQGWTNGVYFYHSKS